MNLEALFEPLLDLMLKSAALLLLGALMQAAFHRASAANRHAIALAIFGALLLLPLTKLVRPLWAFELEPKVATVVKEHHPLHGAEEESAQPVAAPRALNAAPSQQRFEVPWKSVAVAAWLVGVALLLARRALIALRLHGVIRRSRVTEDQRLAVMTRELVEASGVKADVLESALCRVPLVTGIVHSTILMPTDAHHWPAELISSALRHELGHIRRRDCVTRLLAQFVCVIYWANPLVWLAARQMRLAQEQACDDLVLNAGAAADEYAGHLVDVVRCMSGDRFAACHALAMAQPSTLETRVRAIVDVTRDRRPRSLGGSFASIAFVSVMLSLCTVMQLRGAERSRGAQILINAKFIEITSNSPFDTTGFLKGFGAKEKDASLFTLSDPQFQQAIRALSQKKGVDLMSAPGVTTRSGQTATVEVTREFSTATQDKTGKPNPADTRPMHVGVKFEVTPEMRSGGMIGLRMKPRVTEFEGFLDVDGASADLVTHHRDGSFTVNMPDFVYHDGCLEQIVTMGADDAKPLAGRIGGPAIKDSTGHRRVPMFNTRRAQKRATIQAGETIALLLPVREDVQDVEDRVPILSSIPLIGRLFVTRSEDHYTRTLVVFVTARSLKPGQ